MVAGAGSGREEPTGLGARFWPNSGIFDSMKGARTLVRLLIVPIAAVLALLTAGAPGAHAATDVSRIAAALRENPVYVDPAATDLLSRAGDRRTRVAGSAEDAVVGADLVISCLTRRMDPRLDCADADEDDGGDQGDREGGAGAHREGPPAAAPGFSHVHGRPPIDSRCLVRSAGTAAGTRCPPSCAGN